MVLRQNVAQRVDRVDGHPRLAALKARRDGFESARPQRAHIAIVNRQGRDGERSALPLGMADLPVEQRVQKIKRCEVPVVCAWGLGPGLPRETT
jgi:hypothetical protein